MISCNTLSLPDTMYVGHYCCAGKASVSPLVVNVHSLIRATVCQWMLKFNIRQHWQISVCWFLATHSLRPSAFNAFIRSFVNVLLLLFRIWHYSACAVHLKLECMLPFPISSTKYKGCDGAATWCQWCVRCVCVLPGLMDTVGVVVSSSLLNTLSVLGIFPFYTFRILFGVEVEA